MRQPRLCVHTRSHSLAAVLRRMGGYRCTLLRQGRRQRRWLGRCWWLTLALPRRRTKCARRARTTLCAGYSTICIRALTYSSPRCAVWDAAVALCCGRKGVGCGGWGAAGGIPWRRQDEGRGAHAAPAHNLLSCVGCTPSVCMRALTARRRAAQSWKRLPLHFAAAGKASEVVVTALLAAYPGAAKDKVRLPSPRPHNVPSELGRTAYVHTRSHSLAAALHRVGGCFRCTLLRQ